jgi:hypothetical protein
MDRPESKKRKVQGMDKADLVAESARLRAEFADFEEESARLRAAALAKAELEEENTRLKDQEITRLRAEALANKEEALANKEEALANKEEALAKSLMSVLPEVGVANPMPRLVLRGTRRSHLRPKNEDAEVIERQFIVPDVRAADGKLGLGLENKVSSLRAVITNSNGSLRYENKCDVHDYVQQALRDATTICSEIIANQALAVSIPPTDRTRRASRILTIFQYFGSYGCLRCSLGCTCVLRRNQDGMG